ncbi:MAG: hypothetical protein WAT58_12150, partial [Candidatus Dormiibacterota bacterium]
MVSVYAYGKGDITFNTTSVPGTSGTSYVYFQATETSSGRTSTVPTRRFIGCPTPYYMRWLNVVTRPDGTTSYDVQIVDCNTNQPVNDGVSRAGQLRWVPGSRPLLAGTSQLANGQLIYALNVNLSPPVVLPNQGTTLQASIADDFISQADRTLNISVEPNAWSVASWSVDFGDGQTATLPGGQPSMQIPHRYVTPTNINPVVTAHVTGIAHVADFDPFSGNLVLLTAPFAVDVTNSTFGQVAAAPVVAYTPPHARAAGLARLRSDGAPLSDRGLAALEAPRGTPVYLYVRPIIDAEGQMTLDGRPAGDGYSVVLNWRLASGSRDGPPGEVSAPGDGGGGDRPVIQQWNSPDELGARGPTPYAIDLDYTIRTTYPDGQTRDYEFSGR